MKTNLPLNLADVTINDYKGLLVISTLQPSIKYNYIRYYSCNLHSCNLFCNLQSHLTGRRIKICVLIGHIINESLVKIQHFRHEQSSIMS